MKKTVLLIAAFSIAVKLSAKVCLHENLSNKYNFKITTTLSKNEDGEDKISKITLDINGKGTTKNKQKIEVNNPGFLFSGSFENCNAVRSYITGKNKNDEVMDGDYGDFIVEDFNFDGKEDLVIKKDSGGNGGPFYEFYIDNGKGIFEKDTFLTNEVGHFPDKLDLKNKTITTYIHANAYGYNENVYQYHFSTKKWKKVRTTYRKAQ